jgi:SAM-dependent methyltransferase
VVALDVVSDANVGLGRARVLMAHAGVYFDRLIGDAERLPFYDNSFDLVFCAATLHHSSDLPLLCRNIARVLKPGGRLCAIREPCISVGDNEQAVLSRDANDELAVGINENRPNLLHYIEALDGAGLDPLQVAPVNACGLNDVDLHSWGLELGVIPPPVRLDRPKETVDHQRRYWRSRWAAVRQGNYLRAQRLMRRFSGRKQVEAGILLWVSGELLLLAAKRAKE